MKTTNSKASKNPVVAELCLYGTSAVGHGYLLSIPGHKLLGDGEPKAGRDLTTCLFLAAADLSERGIHKGIVQVFAPGGESMAQVDLGWGMPYYGMLKWVAAPVLTISADAITGVR